MVAASAPTSSSAATPASAASAEVGPAGSTGLDVSGTRGLVLSLVKEMRQPVHVAALSVAFRQRTGASIKQRYKPGMLSFLKTHCSADLLVMGEGNDSFVRLATQASRTQQWLHECINTHGPILVSMLGRLFFEAHSRPFGDAHPEGLRRFLDQKMKSVLRFEPLKGNETLVDIKRRDDSRYFVQGRKAKGGAAAAVATGGVLGRLARAMPAAEGDAANASASASVSASVTTSVSVSASASAGRVYLSTERILVVGEADFSWSASLLRQDTNGWPLLVTTSYEPLESLRRKYKGVDQAIKRLTAAGATVAHGVDGTSLPSAHTVREGSPFDLIVFHFPHVGTDQGLKASIAANSALLRGFLKAAAPLLSADGEVHLTLVHRYPYTAWIHGLNADTEETKAAGLVYLGSIPFDFKAYPGYRHQATTNIEGGQLDVVTRCLTHAWRRADAPNPTASRAATTSGRKSSMSPAPAPGPASASVSTLSTGGERIDVRSKKRKGLPADTHASPPQDVVAIAPTKPQKKRKTVKPTISSATDTAHTKPTTAHTISAATTANTAIAALPNDSSIVHVASHGGVATADDRAAYKQKSLTAKHKSTNGRGITITGTSDKVESKQSGTQSAWANAKLKQPSAKLKEPDAKGKRRDARPKQPNAKLKRLDAKLKRP